jgi:hypothetical protein
VWNAHLVYIRVLCYVVPGRYAACQCAGRREAGRMFPSRVDAKNIHGHGSAGDKIAKRLGPEGPKWVLAIQAGLPTCAHASPFGFSPRSASTAQNEG